MSYRSVSFANSEFYHVYNRGVDKRTIFRDATDYRRFLELLYLSNSTHSINIRDIRKVFDIVYVYDRDQQYVHIGAYCLMPNHFHILLTPLRENGVQNFMQKLSTGYSMYFNKRYERTGTLCESKFKAQHADSDEYLKYLFSYIHLNPAKLIEPHWKDPGVFDLGKLKTYVEGYEYSSLRDYLEVYRTEEKILNPETFPPYFSSKKMVDAELVDWLTLGEDMPHFRGKA